MSHYAQGIASTQDTCFVSGPEQYGHDMALGLPALASPCLGMDLHWGGQEHALLLPRQNTDETVHAPVGLSPRAPQHTTPQPAEVPRGSSHTRKMAPGHIKRPCNAFILFRSHAVATNLVPKEVERDHRNISRIISHMWRSLDKSERAVWEAKAAAEKERHHREHPDYKYRPGSRRTNIHRRTVRKLSSTERQCEQIADVILKACGRAGVERRASIAARTLGRGRTAAMTPDVSPHTLRRRTSTDAIGVPSVRLERVASKGCALDLPLAPVPHPLHLDVWGGAAAMPRRSSSAPPLRGLDNQPASPTDSVFSDFLGKDDIASDALHWILNTPLLSANSSPYEIDQSMLATPPMPEGQEILGASSPCPPHLEATRVEQDFQSFSLDAPAPACAAPGLLDLTKHQAPQYMLPPVSPKCVLDSNCWPAPTDHAQSVGPEFTQAPHFGTLASWESTIEGVFPALNGHAFQASATPWDCPSFPASDFSSSAPWPAY